MLARPAQDHDPHRIGVFDPLEDLDDLAPERRVHRVDLLRPVDLDMRDVVCKFYFERLIFGHVTILDCGNRDYIKATRLKKLHLRQNRDCLNFAPTSGKLRTR
ncbi:hypothetical protein D3C81_1771830 [compost metagenome]